MSSERQADKNMCTGEVLARRTAWNLLSSLERWA
jgi:hypothetical protein